MRVASESWAYFPQDPRTSSPWSFARVPCPDASHLFAWRVSRLSVEEQGVGTAGLRPEQTRFPALPKPVSSSVRWASPNLVLRVVRSRWGSELRSGTPGVRLF